MTMMLKTTPTAGRLDAARSAFRTVLVHARPEGGPALASASALARRLDATLFGVAAEAIQLVGYSDPGGLADGQYLVALRELMQANLVQAESSFRAEAEGLAVEWLALEEFPATAMARVSRGADLIVAEACRAHGASEHQACDAAELMLKSGRPVLVVPWRGGELAANAVVAAWKDSREARRALADSLPFLKAAETVTVLEVCDRSESEAARVQTSAVVAGLKRHGVHAVAKVVTGAPEEVSLEAQAEAEAIGADLIVAGGYSHNRLGEWVFGGVTRDLLRAPERFVLLSH